MCVLHAHGNTDLPGNRKGGWGKTAGLCGRGRVKEGGLSAGAKAIEAGGYLPPTAAIASQPPPEDIFVKMKGGARRC